MGLNNLPNLKEIKDKAIGEPRQHDPMSCGVFVCMVSTYRLHIKITHVILTRNIYTNINY
jgi:Ulp1 family protease